MSSAGRYVPLLAVVAAAFLVGNLVYNVENLDWGDEVEPPEGYAAPSSGAGVSNSSAIASALRYVIAGTIILLICGSAVAVAGKASQDKKGFLKSAGAYLLAGGLVIGLFAAVGIAADPHGAVAKYIPFVGGGEVSQGTYGDAGEEGAPTPIATVIVVVALALFAVMAVAAFIFLGKAAKPMSIGGGKDEMRREAAAVLARASDDLAVGGDYRTAVLRCYRDMVKLLSGKGVRDEEHMTAREFEALARGELGLGDELAQLTALFEEARYSGHDVSEGQRELAGRAFERVREALVAAEPGDSKDAARAEGVAADGR
jgi:hypothetical protein